jgi:hypothetical protein
MKKTEQNCILAILTLSKLRFSDLSFGLFISFYKLHTIISNHFTFRYPLRRKSSQFSVGQLLHYVCDGTNIHDDDNERKRIFCANSQAYFTATILQTHTHISNLEDQSSNNDRNEMRRVCLSGVLFGNENPKIKPTAHSVKKKSYKAVHFICMKVNKLSLFRGYYISHYSNIRYLQVRATRKPVNSHINQSRDRNIFT